MPARDILNKLRRQEALTADDMRWFASALAGGGVSDAQAGAFAMGVCMGGLSPDERVALTAAMRDSGDMLTWNVDGPVLDKHSTGGVGDCVSLVLAPALAACGAYVPMISGRGLGHTGGTLDKLSAIPGLRTEFEVDDFQRIVGTVGCAIVGASSDIAPADKRLYAVRDVSGTVESLDLITASILSKKLAEGLEGLVLDVKTGSGALMSEVSDARALAQALVETAQGAGCMTTALITDMSQPAAAAAGNALEMIEVMEALTDPGGVRVSRLVTLVTALGGEALALGGMAEDAQDGGARIARALESGQAAEVFGRMVAAQGGPTDFLSQWRDRLPAAPVVVELRADHPGYISAIDTRAIGELVVAMGGGRRVESDRIDPSVGLSRIIPLGTAVVDGTPLARLHAATPEMADLAVQELVEAITFAPGPITPPPLILERIG